MSASGKFRIGLNLRKKPEEGREEEKKASSKAVAKAFGVDSDEEPEESAGDKFERKYAGSANTKAREQRLLEKELAANPDIFDYDAHYEEIQQQRDQKMSAQKEADKEKKPKYAHSIIKAHKQRELNRLLVEENMYKKEREKEGDEFADKDVFITGAYRAQIEERTRHKAEMEREEALEKMRDVRDQKLWQQAFNRTLLDNISRDYIEPPTASSSADMKTEVKGEMEGGRTDEAVGKQEPKVKEEEIPTGKSEQRHGREHADEANKGTERRQRSRSPSGRRQHRSRSPGVSESRASRTGPEPKRPRRGREERMSEEERRMERIREILRRRNDEQAIEEARQRYLERRARKEIVAPLLV